MAKVAQGLVIVLDPAGHLGFDALESFVGEIERNADERRLVRATPLIAEVDGRTKSNPFRLELTIQLGHESLDASAFDGEANIGDAPSEESIALADQGSVMSA